MESIAELADSLWREKVARARAMTPEERFAEGLRLSDFVFELMRAGIRDRHPHADEAEVTRLLCEQLDRIRRVEERGIYVHLPDSAWEREGVGSS